MSLSDLPLDSGTAHARVFTKLGWSIRRNGNHIVMTNNGRMISIPNHREVNRRTLKRIVSDAGITDEQYRQTYDD